MNRYSVPSNIFKSAKVIIKPNQKNSTLIIQDIKYAQGFAWAGVSDREYRGFFEVSVSSVGFSLINIVNIEEYLYSVLPSEMISSWPEEALKSQAVIARSEALYKKNISKPHKKDNFDLCDDQHCQVYKGVKQETSSTKKAVDNTRSEILEYNGKIAHTLYSSNCSGHTQSSKELNGWSDEAYLQGVIDAEIRFPTDLVHFDKWIKHPPEIFCAPSKYTYYAESRWIRVVSQEELTEQLNQTYNPGSIKKIIPIKRSASGHINHLVIEGTNNKIEIEKENLIRQIVLGRLRSTNFIVDCYGKKNGLPEYFIFWGAGWGHAVGLCQSGAAGMAEKGYKYHEILKRYYKDTYIKKLGY
ncbi:MAG: SpoIID/LytB domain-containing protein [Elusimicrobiota bacterium]